VTPAQVGGIAVREEPRDGIRTHTGVVDQRDGRCEGFDLRCAESKEDRNEDAGSGHGGRGGDDHGSAGDSSLETGEYTPPRVTSMS